METVNISLPKELNQQIDKAIKEQGYASRSEFFRTLIRFYFALSVTDTAVENPIFTPFKKKSLAKVKKELANANRYSSAFIESVVEGLAKSSLYKNKK